MAEVREGRRLFAALASILAMAAAGPAMAQGDAPGTPVVIEPPPAVQAPVAPAELPPLLLSPGDQIEVSFYRNYATDSHSYALDVGDVLSIVVEDHPELSAETVVRPDGMISVPLLWDMKAGGTTPDDLRERLRAAYAAKIPTPVVTVFVRSPQAKLDEFFKTLMSGDTGATKSLLVRPDGTLSFPLLGEVHVAGQSVAKVQSDLSARYQAIFRYIDVSINVVNSNHQKITVIGEVARPGVFPLIGVLSLPQALAMAGGFLDTAQPKSVVVVRPQADQSYVGMEYNLKEMFKGGPLLSNVLLQAQDIVVVPKSGIAKVDKWVDQYIRKVLPFNIGAGVFYTINGNATN
jgi:polysaccharide export outer membrane protein